MAKVFRPTNPEKLSRAQVIAALVIGTREVKNDEEQTLKARHAEILNQKEVSLKDEEAVIESVYLTLGGGVSHYESDEEVETAEPKKARASKSKKA